MAKLNFGIIAGIFLLVLGCASQPEEKPREVSRERTVATSLDMLMSDLTPRDSRPVFLGISPRLRDRDEEEDRAILHVAEQASRYTRLAARYRLITQRGGRSADLLDDIITDWDPDYAETLVEHVEVLQSFQDHQGTYIVAAVSQVPPAPQVQLGGSARGGEPEWVNRPPAIPGFLVTVGTTLRSHRLRNSIDIADQDALKDILLLSGASVRSLEDRRDVDRVGTFEQTIGAQEASAVLSQFLVLARHTSADGRYFYSLVVAREDPGQ